MTWRGEPGGEHTPQHEVVLSWKEKGGRARRRGAHPAIDLAHLREHTVERIEQPPLPCRLGGSQQQRIKRVHGAHYGPKGAAAVRLLRIPVPLEARGEQFLHEDSREGGGGQAGRP